MTAPVLSPAPRRHARLIPYAGWQFRDYAMNVAAISIILFGLIGALDVIQVQTMAEGAGTNKVFIANLARMQTASFSRLLGIYVTLGPIVALSGIISQDRSMGYVRFLFAKPLNPLRFYLQSFAVRLIGYLVVAAALILLYRQFEPIADASRIAAGLLISFIAYGGFIFLASAFSKYDGLLVIAFLLLSTLAWGKWATAKSGLRFIPDLLPPIGQFTDLPNWVSNINSLDPKAAAVFPTKWVVWTVCYGVACLLLGLVVLRKRPLARA